MSDQRPSRDPGVLSAIATETDPRVRALLRAEAKQADQRQQQRAQEQPCCDLRHGYRLTAGEGEDR